jgi:hypothetical protein
MVQVVEPRQALDPREHGEEEARVPQSL